MDKGLTTRAHFSESLQRSRLVGTDRSLGIARTDEQGKLLQANEAIKGWLPPKTLYLWEALEPSSHLREAIHRVAHGQPSEEVLTVWPIGQPSQQYALHLSCFTGAQLSPGVALLLEPLMASQESAAAPFEMAILDAFSDDVEEGLFVGNAEGRIAYCSQPLVAMFRYGSGQSLDTAPFGALFMHPERAHWAWQIAMAMGQTGPFQAEMVRQDGSRFEARVRMYAVEEEGVFWLVGAVLDITQEKSAQATLEKASVELDQLRHQIDRFLYSACHDLRSPISSMQGLLHLMEMEPTLNAEYMKRMHTSLNKLEGVTRDMLTLAKNSHERPQNRRIQFDLLVKEVVDSIATEPEFERVQLQTEIACPFPIYADTSRLKSILYHLLKNAYQFHNPQQSPPLIKLQIVGDAHGVKVTLCDNGEGIPKLHLDKVFDMFYRASENSQGSGMGLYIVNETIQRLGGKMTVDSALGSGTVFTFWIPNGIKGRLKAQKMELYRERTTPDFVKSDGERHAKSTPVIQVRDSLPFGWSAKKVS